MKIKTPVLTDKEFLIWIYERLERVHGELHIFDYMRRFRYIIETIPINQKTHNEPPQIKRLYKN
jgi:hypothetical protein